MTSRKRDARSRSSCSTKTPRARDWTSLRRKPESSRYSQASTLVRFLVYWSQKSAKLLHCLRLRGTWMTILGLWLTSTLRRWRKSKIGLRRKRSTRWRPWRSLKVFGRSFRWFRVMIRSRSTSGKSSARVCSIFARIWKRIMKSLLIILAAFKKMRWLAWAVQPWIQAEASLVRMAWSTHWTNSRTIKIS